MDITNSLFAIGKANVLSANILPTIKSKAPQIVTPMIKKSTSTTKQSSKFADAFVNFIVGCVKFMERANAMTAKTNAFNKIC